MTEYDFDAFLSYSTDPDYFLVREIESFLESFHKIPVPQSVKLKRLEVCRDGSDFQLAINQNVDINKNPSNIISQVVEERLAKSQFLIVFCSRKSRESSWVEREINWFLTNRSRDSILLVVTEGIDPGRYPEDFFSQIILNNNLHEKIWYDFRGFREQQVSNWHKVRDYKDERIRLAADLNGSSAGVIQPLWYREEQRQNQIKAALLAPEESKSLVDRGFVTRGLRFALDNFQLDTASGDRSYYQPLEKAIYYALHHYSSEVLRFQAHQGRIRDAKVSSDGKYLATAGDDNTTTLWQLDLENEKFRWSHDDEAWTVDFSPDSKLIASGGDDLRISVWRTEDGELVHSYVEEQNQEKDLIRIRHIVFSPRGKYLLAAYQGGIAKIWRVSDFDEIATLETPFAENGFDKGIFSSDETSLFLLSGWASDEPSIWNPLDGSFKGFLNGQTGVYHLKFNPVGNRFATGDSEGHVRLWSYPELHLITEFGQHKDGVRDLQFNPTGSILASSDRIGIIKLWDGETGEFLGNLQGHDEDFVNRIDFTSDGNWLISGGDDNNVIFWDIKTKQLFDKMSGHSHRIWRVQSVPDSPFVMSASWDGQVRFWNLLASKQTHQCILEGDLNLCAMGINEDRSRLAIASKDGSLTLLDLNLGKVIYKLSAKNSTTGEILEIGIDPSGKNILLVTESGVQHINFNDDRSVQYSTLLEESLVSGYISAFDEYIYVVTREQSILKIDIKTRNITEISSIEPNNAVEIAGSSDGNIIIYGSLHGMTLLDGQSSLLEFLGKGCIVNINFDTHYNRILFSTLSGVFDVVEIASRKRISLKGHSDRVIVSTISSTYRFYASGDASGNVIIWNCETLNQVQHLSASSAVMSIDFSMIDDKILIAYADGSVILWDIEIEAEILRIQQDEAIRLATFAPEERSIFTISEFGSIYRWCYFNSRSKLVEFSRTLMFR